MPEKYIYGCLLTIIPKTEELVQYQKEAYEALYNHSHLKQAARKTELQTRTLPDEKIEALEAKLKETNEFEELETLKTKRKAIYRTLAAMDKGIYQTALF